MIQPGHKAISLWQPWASLWLSPLKIHETRHWKTDYRGPLIVHAAQKLVSECGEEVDELCVNHFGPHWRKELPRGALLGRLELVSMISSNSYPINEWHSNYICGNWAADRWGWQRGDFTVFPRAIPFKGKQGFFNVPDELVPR